MSTKEDEILQNIEDVRCAFSYKPVVQDVDFLEKLYGFELYCCPPYPDTPHEVVFILKFEGLSTTDVKLTARTTVKELLSPYEAKREVDSCSALYYLDEEVEDEIQLFYGRASRAKTKESRASSLAIAGEMEWARDAGIRVDAKFAALKPGGLAEAWRLKSQQCSKQKIFTASNKFGQFSHKGKQNAAREEELLLTNFEL
jgi:hypothetical protein